LKWFEWRMNAPTVCTKTPVAALYEPCEALLRSAAREHDQCSHAPLQAVFRTNS
jgi:hypothetical protein